MKGLPLMAILNKCVTFYNFNVLFISECQNQKIALWAQKVHQLPQNEVHTNGQELEPDAGPEVHEDAGPLLSVQSQSSHYQPVHGVWANSYRGGIIHLPSEGDSSEVVQHHERDQPAAKQPAPDAINTYSSGKDVRDF